MEKRTMSSNWASKYKQLLENVTEGYVTPEEIEAAIKDQVQQLKHSFEELKLSNKDSYKMAYGGCLYLATLEFCDYVTSQGYTVEVTESEHNSQITTFFTITKEDKTETNTVETKPTNPIIEEQVGVLKRLLLDSIEKSPECTNHYIVWEGVDLLKITSKLAFNVWAHDKSYQVEWSGDVATITIQKPATNPKIKFSDQLRSLCKNSITPYTLLRDDFIAKSTEAANKGKFCIYMFIKWDKQPNLLAEFKKYLSDEGFIEPHVTYLTANSAKLGIVW